MKALRRLVKVTFIVLAGWILLPVLVAYNDVILLWFNFLVDDSLVNRLTFDAVEALHAEVFEPIVVPRVSLFVLLVILTWFVLRRTRPSASPS